MTNVDTTVQADLRALRVKVRNTHILSPKDAEIDEAIEYILQNIDDFEAGAASPRRGFFVAGPAGTGKSTALKYAFSKIADFLPRVDKYGETVRPLVSVKLPKKCLTRDIIVAILDAMDLPHEGNEREMTDYLLVQFKERKTKLLHLDELQHTVRSNSKAAFEAVQDLLKQLMDRDDWALHVICSGMPKIEKMREEDQIGRRSKVIPFHPMEFPDDAEWIGKLVESVAVEGCGLSLAPELKAAEFHERLCKATKGAWGTMIETIQSASFRARARGRKELTIRHFAQEYEATSGCALDDNIFTSPHFKDIDPSKSLASMTEE